MQCSDRCQKASLTAVQKGRLVAGNLENSKWKPEFLSQPQGMVEENPFKCASSLSLMCQSYSLPSTGAADHKKKAAGNLPELETFQVPASLLALIRFLNNNQLSWVPVKHPHLCRISICHTLTFIILIIPHKKMKFSMNHPPEVKVPQKIKMKIYVWNTYETPQLYLIGPEKIPFRRDFRRIM